MKHPAFRPIFPPVTLDELLAALDADAPQMDYHGISYWRRWHDWTPDWLWTRIIYPLWARWRCSRGRHLLDEVWSIDEHELICDACGMHVGVAYIVPGGEPTPGQLAQLVAQIKDDEPTDGWRERLKAL